MSDSRVPDRVIVHELECKIVRTDCSRMLVPSPHGFASIDQPWNEEKFCYRCGVRCECESIRMAIMRVLNQRHQHVWFSPSGPDPARPEDPNIRSVLVEPAVVEPECDHCHQKVQPGYQALWHTTSETQTKRYDCYPSPTGRHMVDGSAVAWDPNDDK